MKEDITASQLELFCNDQKAFPKKPEEPVGGPFNIRIINIRLPLLQASQITTESLSPANSIPPGQRQPASPVSWSIEKNLQIIKKTESGSYAPYFQGN